jgi:hypothetical protein
MGSQKRTVLCHWGWVVTLSLSEPMNHAFVNTVWLILRVIACPNLFKGYSSNGAGRLVDHWVFLDNWLLLSPSVEYCWDFVPHIKCSNIGKFASFSLFVCGG